jgi:hypothetical protein
LRDFFNEKKFCIWKILTGSTWNSSMGDLASVKAQMGQLCSILLEHELYDDVEAFHRFIVDHRIDTEYNSVGRHFESVNYEHIVWPERYAPGTTDNYVSNEIIVAGLTTADVWPFLNNTSTSPTYYSNVSDIRFYDGSGSELHLGARFRFTTFSFPKQRSRNTSHPQRASRPGWPGTVGWKAHRRPRWMSTTLGCWRTYPAAGCGSSPR